MRRHPAFADLDRILRESSALRDRLIEPKAYRLLDEARLEDRYIGNFCRTYRLPDSPFFALFLSSKRECRELALKTRVARGKRIVAIMRTYPKDILGLVKYLAKVERMRNADFPVWKRELFPRTLKRARELAGAGLEDWLPLLSDCIEKLRGRYRRLELPDSELLFARMLLRCLGDPRTGILPPPGAVERNYRELRAAYLAGSDEERRRLPLLDAARAKVIGMGKHTP